MINRKDSCFSAIIGLKVLCVCARKHTHTHTNPVGSDTWVNTHTQKYKAELLPFMVAGGRDMRRAVLISSSQLASSVICTKHTHTHTQRKKKCPPINNESRGVQGCRYLHPALSDWKREREEDVWRREEGWEGGDETSKLPIQMLSTE